jgi:tetratricopeptide (TPR) repeat protein
MRRKVTRCLCLLVLAVASCSQQSAVPVIDTARLDVIARRTVEERLNEVKAHPNSGVAWGQLGTVLRAFDYPLEAERCLREAERLDSNNPRWPYFRSLLATSENPDEAIAHLRRAVGLCGNEPEMPRLRLAKLLGEQGRWNEAQGELQQLLAAKPDFAPAELLLAQRAHAEEKHFDAISLATRCTNDIRTARTACSLLATLYQRTGDAAAAASAMRKSATLPKDAPVADPFETEATLLRNNPREIALRTHELLAALHLQEAASAIDRLVKGHPQFAEGWLLLGRLQILQRQFVAAEQSLRHFLQLEPMSTQGLFQLGTTLLSQNRFLEAADTFQKATEIQRDFGPAHFNCGFALARAGKLREAVPSFREAIRHNPDHIESYLLLADLHRQMGERDEALKLVEEGLALNPADQRLQQLRATLK